MPERATGKLKKVKKIPRKPLKKTNWKLRISEIFIIFGLAILIYGTYENDLSYFFLGIGMIVIFNSFSLYFKKDKQKSRYDFVNLGIVLVLTGYLTISSIVYYQFYESIPSDIVIKVPVSSSQITQSFNGSIALSCVEYNDTTLSCIPLEIRNIGTPFKVSHPEDVINKGICDYDVPNALFNCTWYPLQEVS